jgi:hypothetical protein
MKRVLNLMKKVAKGYLNITANTYTYLGTSGTVFMNNFNK